MDLFGGAPPRAHQEIRAATADDAWRAAVVAGDLDLLSVNREAARRVGAPERAMPPAWAALALEGLATRALGEGARVVALDLRHRVALRVGEEVTLSLVALEGDGESFRATAQGSRGGLAEGTLRVRFEEARA